MQRAFFTVSLLLLGFAAWLTFGVSAHYLMSGQHAVGYVVEVIDDGGSYIPLVQYNTAAGETRYYRGLGSGQPAYRLGESVAIRYLPDEPWRAVISSSFHEMWLMPILAGGFGALFGGFGILLRFAKKPRPQVAAAATAPRRTGTATRPRQQRNEWRNGKKKKRAARRNG